MLAMIHAVTVVLAETDSDSSFGAIGYIFLLSGFVFYGYVFMRYRNVTKRHHHETETEVKVLNMQQSDQKIQSLTGLSNSRMRGANNTSVSGSGGMGFALGQLKGLTGQLSSFMEQAQKSAGGGTGSPASPSSTPPTAPPSTPPSPPSASPTAPPPSSPPQAAPPPSPPPPGPPPQGGGQPGGSSF